MASQTDDIGGIAVSLGVNVEAFRGRLKEAKAAADAIAPASGATRVLTFTAKFNDDKMLGKLQASRDSLQRAINAKPIMATPVLKVTKGAVANFVRDFRTQLVAGEGVSIPLKRVTFNARAMRADIVAKIGVLDIPVKWHWDDDRGPTGPHGGPRPGPGTGSHSATDRTTDAAARRTARARQEQATQEETQARRGRQRQAQGAPPTESNAEYRARQQRERTAQRAATATGTVRPAPARVAPPVAPAPTQAGDPGLVASVTGSTVQSGVGGSVTARGGRTRQQPVRPMAPQPGGASGYRDATGWHAGPRPTASAAPEATDTVTLKCPDCPKTFTRRNAESAQLSIRQHARQVHRKPRVQADRAAGLSTEEIRLRSEVQASETRMGFASSLPPASEGKARGGRITRKAIVGERGTEAFVPDRMAGRLPKSLRRRLPGYADGGEVPPKEYRIDLPMAPGERIDIGNVRARAPNLTPEDIAEGKRLKALGIDVGPGGRPAHTGGRGRRSGELPEGAMGRQALQHIYHAPEAKGVRGARLAAGASYAPKADQDRWKEAISAISQQNQLKANASPQAVRMYDANKAAEKGDFGPWLTLHEQTGDLLADMFEIVTGRQWSGQGADLESEIFSHANFEGYPTPASHPDLFAAFQKKVGKYAAVVGGRESGAEDYVEPRNVRQGVRKSYNIKQDPYGRMITTDKGEDIIASRNPLPLFAASLSSALGSFMSATYNVNARVGKAGGVISGTSVMGETIGRTKSGAPRIRRPRVGMPTAEPSEEEAKPTPYRPKVDKTKPRTPEAFTGEYIGARQLTSATDIPASVRTARLEALALEKQEIEERIRYNEEWLVAKHVRAEADDYKRHRKSIADQKILLEKNAEAVKRTKGLGLGGYVTAAMGLRVTRPFGAKMAPEGQVNVARANTYEWKKLRAATIRQQPWCSYCGIGRTESRATGNPLTADHKISQAEGGDPWDPSNLHTICKSCNSAKGHLSHMAVMSQQEAGFHLHTKPRKYKLATRAGGGVVSGGGLLGRMLANTLDRSGKVLPGQEEESARLNALLGVAHGGTPESGGAMRPSTRHEPEWVRRAREKNLVAKDYSGRAGGGGASGAVLVGERGPEVFVPHESGWIIPHHLMDQLPTRAGGGPVRLMGSNPQPDGTWHCPENPPRKFVSKAALNGHLAHCPAWIAMNQGTTPPSSGASGNVTPAAAASIPTPGPTPTNPAAPTMPGVIAGSLNYGASGVSMGAYGAGMASKAMSGTPIRVFVVNWPATLGGGGGGAQGNIGGIGVQQSAPVPPNPSVSGASGGAAPGTPCPTCGGTASNPKGKCPNPIHGAKATPVVSAIPKATLTGKQQARESASLSREDVRSRLEAARTNVSEALQFAPVRALSVSMGQIFQTAIGGRAGILERQRHAMGLISAAGKASTNVERQESDIHVLAQRRQALREEMANRKQNAILDKKAQNQQPEMIKINDQLKDAGKALVAARKVEKTKTEAAEDASGKILTRAQGIRAQAAGAIGITIGTLAFSAAMDLAQQGLAAFGKAVDPVIDALSGFANTSNKITASMVDAFRASGGNIGTVSAGMGQVGLSASMAKRIGPAIAGRVGLEAGNRNIQDQIDYLKTWVNITKGGALQNMGGPNQGIPGLTKPTGGLFGTSLMAVPSTVEQIAGLAGPSANEQGIMAGLGATLPFNLGALLPKQGGTMGGQDMVDYLQGQAKKAGEGFATFNQAFDVKDLQSTSDALKAIGASSDDISRIVGAGIAIHGPQGQSLSQAKTPEEAAGWAQSALMAVNIGSQTPTPELMVAEAKRSLQAQQRSITRAMIQQQEMFIPADFAMNLAAHPLPSTVGQGILPMGASMANPSQAGTAAMGGLGAQFSGVPQEDITSFGNYAGTISDTRKELSALAAEGEQKMRDMAASVGIPTAKFDEQLAAVKSLGKEIQALNEREQNLQLGHEQAQYNHQLFLAKRNLGDIVGLAGKEATTVAAVVGFRKDGSAITKDEVVHATQLGKLNRAQWEDSRKSQQLSLMMNQRQLNFQLAMAHLVTPGSTPEERATAAREAEAQAKVAQEQQNIGLRQFGREGQIFKITVSRELTDAVVALKDMQEGRAITVEIRGIEAAKAAKEALLGVKVALLDTSSTAAKQWADAANQVQTSIEAAAGKFDKLFATEISGLMSDITASPDFQKIWDVLNPGAVITGAGGTAANDFSTDPVQRSLGVGQPNAAANDFSTDPVQRSLGVGQPGSGTPGENTDGTWTSHSAGSVFKTTGPTNITVGEAGQEEVAIIRNPRAWVQYPGAAMTPWSQQPGNGTRMPAQAKETGNGARMPGGTGWVQYPGAPMMPVGKTTWSPPSTGMGDWQGSQPMMPASSITINNPVVRDDSDITEMVRLIEQALNRKALTMGLNSRF